MKIGIVPGVKMLAVLRHLKYKPWFALAEFVDNSLQSFFDNQHQLHNRKLRVTIEFDREAKSIIVSDNAAGISEAEFSRAFRSAEPPLNASGLSQFGMGMKSAACWFAPLWEVRTLALGESVERTVRFDVNRIVSEQIEELEIETTPRAAENCSPFTEVILRNVFALPQTRTITKIREHLADIYHPILEANQFELVVHGQEILASTPEILEAPRYSRQSEPLGDAVLWRKDIQFEMDDGRIVVGEAGIRAKTNSKKAGLSLHRRMRAIVGTADEKYRPHELVGGPTDFRSIRLWGHLHLDDFEVSHTKDGFKWGSSEEEFINKLKEQLNAEPLPILRQMTNYRVGSTKKKKKQEESDETQETANETQEAADEALGNVADALEESAGPDLNSAASETSPAPEPAIELEASSEPPVTSRTFNIENSGRSWKVTIELVSSDNRGADWLELACDQDEANRSQEVALRVHLSNPFMRRIVRVDERDSLEPVLRLAAAVGLAEVIARYSGLNNAGPGEVRRVVNRLLKHSLSCGSYAGE